MLPDVLNNDLKIVFCGTAVGNQSAANNAYYANPGNKFWTVLNQIALTPTKVNPHDHNSLLEYGLGITDLVKTKHGVDNELSSSDFDRDGLTQRIIRFSPKVLCFNGKKAAQEYFSRKEIIFGYQKEVIGRTKLFVAPSTSGSANRYWNIDYWLELAKSVSSFDSADLIISLDSNSINADWTKRTWDLPPYKSKEFMDFLRSTGSSLEQFKRTNVYRFAVNEGLIVDDEWGQER